MFYILKALHYEIFLRTPEILRTGSRQHTTIGCNIHCKTTQKMHLVTLRWPDLQIGLTRAG